MFDSGVFTQRGTVPGPDQAVTHEEYTLCLTLHQGRKQKVVGMANSKGEREVREVPE